MEKEIRKARQNLRKLYGKYVKEFFNINKKIDEYLEVLEKKGEQDVLLEG